MTIIQDDTANCLYYSRDKLIGCNEVFTTYIDYLFDLKERKIPKAKLANIKCIVGQVIRSKQT